MVRVNNCCECFDLRSGTVYIAVVYLVVAVLNIVLSILGLASTGGDAARYGGIAVDGGLLILCIILLIGVIKSNHLFCVVWVIGAAVWTVLTILVGVVATVVISLFIHASKTTDMEAQPVAGLALGTALVLMWGIKALEVPLMIYSIMVVYSHAQNLREGDSLPPYSHMDETTKPAVYNRQ